MTLRVSQQEIRDLISLISCAEASNNKISNHF